MIRRPPRSTLFPYTNALPICCKADALPAELHAHPCNQFILKHFRARRTPIRTKTEHLRSTQVLSQISKLAIHSCSITIEQPNPIAEDLSAESRRRFRVRRSRDSLF